MTLDQLLGAIGAFGATLGVGVVKGHHGVAITSKTIAKQDHERMVLGYACSMREKYPVVAITGETPGHLSTGPRDGD
jgi:hypothetical protein